VAQQLRETTPFGEGPRFLIRDNDKKYGERFQHVADGANIDILKTPVEAPQANAFCGRFLSSLRRECLDYLLILSERHLRRIVHKYVTYFNQARPQISTFHVPRTYPTILTVRLSVFPCSVACIMITGGKPLESRRSISRATCTIQPSSSLSMGGRPGFLPCLNVHLRRTKSRCQPITVSGLNNRILSSSASRVSLTLSFTRTANAASGTFCHRGICGPRSCFRSTIRFFGVSDL
jgi:hypothetical protein